MEPLATIAKIRPFWGRVTVVPSPVDETQLGSGIVLPHQFDGDDGVQRGVVQEIDLARSEELGSAEDLAPGTVVYYRNGTRILDVVVIERPDILAYET